MSLLTANVPAIGDDAIRGELAAELFVLALYTMVISVFLMMHESRTPTFSVRFHWLLL